MYFFQRRPKVVFLYAERYKHSGSTIMRGRQLSYMVKKRYGRQFKILYRPLSVDYRDSIIFLTKGAVTDVTQDQISVLREKGNRVLLDPVDNPLDETKASVSNGVIAASLEAFDAYSKMGYATYLINHHTDTRLPSSHTPPADKLRCGYFGELVNTIVTNKISEKVDFVHVDTGKQSSEWLKKIQLYNLHYAVRSSNVEAYKPFLKGFTAARFSSNIIIQRDQKEAIRWLGNDYPYLISANPKEKDIVGMLNYIQKSFGSDEWKRALKKMEEIKQLTSESAVIDEFLVTIKKVLSK